MAKKNVMCIERLYSDELMHAETSAAKRQYNREYYQQHKQYWKDYYKTGHGIGRTQAIANINKDHEKLSNEEMQLVTALKKGAISSEQFDKLLGDYHAKQQYLKKQHTAFNDPESVLKDWDAKEQKYVDQMNKYLMAINDIDASSDEVRAAKRNYEGAKKNWKRFINDRNNSDDYKTAVDEYMRKNGPKMLREEGSTETLRQQRKPYAKVEKKYKKSGGSSHW